MDLALQVRLYNTYPKFFAQKNLNICESMSVGIDCGNGWYNLIEQLCSVIQHHINNAELKHNNLSWWRRILKTSPEPFKATQVKEKFGGLRFNYNGGDDFISGVVDMAESMSYHICDICGSEGKCGSRGNSNWIVARCGKHRATHWYIDEKKDQGAVAIDFDGVINSYESGFVSIDNIPDPPVEGAFEFIDRLLEARFKVYIFSTRNSDPKGLLAISDWMLKHGMSQSTLDMLHLTTGKPIAKVYIDDRAWEFRGVWPSMTEIAHFQPWHGGKSSSQ